MVSSIWTGTWVGLEIWSKRRQQGPAQNVGQSLKEMCWVFFCTEGGGCLKLLLRGVVDTDNTVEFKRLLDRHMKRMEKRGLCAGR